MLNFILCKTKIFLLPFYYYCVNCLQPSYYYYCVNWAIKPAILHNTKLKSEEHNIKIVTSNRFGRLILRKRFVYLSWPQSNSEQKIIREQSKCMGVNVISSLVWKDATFLQRQPIFQALLYSRDGAFKNILRCSRDGGALTNISRNKASTWTKITFYDIDSMWAKYSAQKLRQ